MLRRYASVVLCGLAVTLPAAPAPAAPTGQQVIEGNATFKQDGNTTTIDTTTHDTIVRYDSFDIHPDEVVQINQPTADSRILNHVPHGDPTRVDGQLLSNGLVYIVNPSGVFLGDTAIVDVGGLVAAAGDVDYGDFLAHNDRFTNLSGDVETAPGARVGADRLVALVGRRVANYGSVITQSGMVAFVAGHEAALGSLDGHLVVHIDGGDEPQGDDAGFALTQGGSVDAGNGSVLLSAGDTWSLALNHTGLTRGRDVQLEAQGDALVKVAGTIDASAHDAGETGGSIRVVGGRVDVEGARLDASGDAGGGEILVGGDVQGTGPATAARTYVGPDAQLVADAGRSGDGGKIVVWADEATGFHGSASARGGADSGDGGFIEISGRQLLETGGHSVDLTAPNGSSGTLLYDPAIIEIMGGTGDGSDLPDTLDSSLVGDGGAAGRILTGDIGTGDTPFVIYESEIEGTNADIVLRAEKQVVSQTANMFTDGAVTLQPGNSLVIQTTGSPDSGFGIDLKDVTWQVSQGGVIFISTNAGDTANPDPSTAADINVGHLEVLGRRFTTSTNGGIGWQPFLDPDLQALGIQQTGDLAASITTKVGSITVGSISADGEDAANQGLQPASPGGSVQVIAHVGDVTVGTVTSTGGSAVASDGTNPASPSQGGSGGNVTLESDGGTVTVNDLIDVSGGGGLSGEVTLTDGSSVPVVGDGGTGGTISIVAQNSYDLTDANPQVQLFGDLISRGGEGLGVIGEPLSAGSVTQVASVGGSGGAIYVSGDAGLLAQGANGADPENLVVDVSVSGGDGVGGGGAGGSTSPLLPSFAPITFEVPTGPQLELDDVRFEANGGNALAGGSGGPGGNPGGIQVIANGGSVSGNASFVADGGDAVAGPPGEFATAQPGGSTTSGISVQGAMGVTLGSIESLGGAGANGPGGRGGEVDIRSGTGDITLADINVSGGDVLQRVDGAPPPDGGGGGVVQVQAGDPNLVPSGASAAGSVLLTDRVVAFGGSGFDAQGRPTTAGGGQVTIDAPVGAIVEESPAGAVEAGTIMLTAPQIGTIDAPVALAGTLADGDQATLISTATVTSPATPTSPAEITPGGIHADLLGMHGPDLTASGSGLEDLTIVHEGGDVASTLTRAGVGDMLDASAEDGVLPTRIMLMNTEDGDPALHFRLSAVPDPDPTVVVDPNQQTADLQIDEGAVVLGSAGGSITDVVGSIVGANPGGTLPHITSSGNLRLEARSPLIASSTPPGTVRNIGISSDPNVGAEPLRLVGGADAALTLVVNGGIDIGIDATAFHGVDVTQYLSTGSTQIDGLDAIQVDGSAGLAADPLQTLTGNTASGTDFAYRLTPTDGSAPSLEVVGGLDLGGNGVLVVPGELRLWAPDPVGTNTGGTIDLGTAGSQLMLVADAGIIGGNPAADVSWSSPDPTSGLVLVSQNGSASLVTQGIGRLAADVGGDLGLTNDGSSDLRIAQIEVPAPTDPSGETVERTQSLVRAGGDVRLDNGTGDIVLAAIPQAAPDQPPLHVSAGGVVDLAAKNVRIENAQLVSLPQDGGLAVEQVAANGASIAAVGDVSLRGTVETGANQVGGQTVDATLKVTSKSGTVHFYGNVGGDDMAASGALARLDTSAARLEGAAGDTLYFHVAQAIFRGLDGPAAANIVGEAASLPDGETQTSVAFGGNVGARTPLGGLTVSGEDKIDFAVAGGGSAERVVAGIGGIHLATTATGVPPAATIADTQGDLAFQTSGTFSVGDFDKPDNFDKLSVLGALSIAASQVEVGDLSASSITVHSPDIQVRARAASDVLLPDGSTVRDGGVDWVANSIVATSVPRMTNETDPALSFYLGSGGIRVPGSLAGVTVSRLNSGFGAVKPGLFFGPEGAVLDLTGNGPRLVGDPGRQMPRNELVHPSTPAPRFGDEPPAPAPRVGAAQVLAFLRCGGAYRRSAGTGCGPDDQAALSSVKRFRDSALATARAREITARYRELVASPGAASHLRETFAAAGRAFAATREWHDGTFDGAAFYRFLESSPREQAPALASVRELAWLFAQIDLLGLADADTQRLQQTLAQEFSQAAGLSGLSADQVTAAVDASPVGLLR